MKTEFIKIQDEKWQEMPRVSGAFLYFQCLLLLLPIHSLFLEYEPLRVDEIQGGGMIERD